MTQVYSGLVIAASFIPTFRDRALRATPPSSPLTDRQARSLHPIRRFHAYAGLLALRLLQSRPPQSISFLYRLHSQRRITLSSVRTRHAPMVASIRLMPRRTADYRRPSCKRRHDAFRPHGAHDICEHRISCEALQCTCTVFEGPPLLYVACEEARTCVYTSPGMPLKAEVDVLKSLFKAIGRTRYYC